VLIRSAELIGWALGGIEREITETRKKLAALTAQAAQLRSRVGIRAGRTVAAVADAVAAEGETIAVAVRKRRRRKMSPEARKRMSEMMKKRWAERKKAVK
jgi:predicted transcriptional regulator